MKWVYGFISISVKKTPPVHGMRTNPPVLGAGAAIPALGGTAGVNPDFLLEPCSERHMIAVCTREGQKAVSRSSLL